MTLYSLVLQHARPMFDMLHREQLGSPSETFIVQHNMFSSSIESDQHVFDETRVTNRTASIDTMYSCIIGCVPHLRYIRVGRERTERTGTIYIGSVSNIANIVVGHHLWWAIHSTPQANKLIPFNSHARHLMFSSL